MSLKRKRLIAISVLLILFFGMYKYTYDSKPFCFKFHEKQMVSLKDEFKIFNNILDSIVYDKTRIGFIKERRAMFLKNIGSDSMENNYLFLETVDDQDYCLRLFYNRNGNHKAYKVDISSNRKIHYENFEIQDDLIKSILFYLHSDMSNLVKINSQINKSNISTIYSNYQINQKSNHKSLNLGNLLQLIRTECDKCYSKTILDKTMPCARCEFLNNLNYIECL